MYNEFGRIQHFKNIETKDDLLYVLNISSRKYNYLVYQKKNLYTSFYINKKQGGFRKILSPCYDLKKIQKELNIIMSNNYEFNNETVHGFVKEHSIKTNATVHKDANYIVNIDLKNFFDNIHFGRVRGMFMKPPFNFSDYIATNLAKLTCYEKKLPQGAPTSPTISNIICYRMDRELSYLCNKYNCRYTRYADDITISTKMLYLPKEIAKFRDGQVILSSNITDTIKNEGFTINIDKLKISPNTDRQEVTGLIVNKKVNVQKVYIKKLRALLNNVSKYGFYLEGCKYFEKTLNDCSNKDYVEHRFINVLKGKIEFLKMIRGIDDYVYIKYASLFNELIGYEYFDTDYGLTMKEFIEKRVYPLISYDEMVQGTCFMADEIGMITSTHVLISPQSFITENKYKEIELKDKFNFCTVGSKPFYILDHYNRKYIINPEITREQINSDILFYKCIPSKKRFKINMTYEPKIGETVYLAGYGEFKDFKTSTINYIKSNVTGYTEFLGRKVACINSKIYHGMSGGPVLNSNREVIGIIYAGLNLEDDDNGVISKTNGFVLFQ
ncbi:MAG: trypsin-like peptidase domain-containing protein [Bacilli bacterium]|nr:trypsin-like peptidase domain-containing protein [Bacilli bacterium]